MSDAYLYYQTYRKTQRCAWGLGQGHCDKGPIVGVYVSDDDARHAVPLCQAHAEHAEEHGDGPVLWV